ncbi:peptide methionine sulfoxide reductase A2-1 [Eurytemora carolleeae]|uniref:peptide methionine sulfoxide reductase A2-1 n=1 Tax=Eurytemora carolleeae TaxID=1294199 RepID=UPI000C789A0C|nr:peptide methionine sulfoxide reductase A2-1 [Eurytemora carolleeae]|eukprot:XP_023322347.1 peptide methionine sulfoxide reductase A2-1-like [Eurytemora affinis]
MFQRSGQEPDFLPLSCIQDKSAISPSHRRRLSLVVSKPAVKIDDLHHHHEVLQTPPIDIQLRQESLMKPLLLNRSVPRILLCSGIFNWSAAMGSGPVKGFMTPEVNQIITKKVKEEDMKIAKEEGEKATFAAGCFWGVELAFQRVPGVLHTMEVCSGSTGHTEAVQMIFNSAAVSYKELLTVLFDRMDPTALNRQGNDVGTQYRSGIYYHSEDQKAIADEFVKEVTPKYKGTIVVEIKQAAKFWPAEDYHQHYLEKGSQKAEKGCLDPIKCYG